MMPQCLVMQDEAFHVWQHEWALVYDEESESRALLATLANSYWLVSLVENDYVNGDIFKVFGL